MKTFQMTFLSIITLCFTSACFKDNCGGDHACGDHSAEKPVQHLKLEDLSSGVEAKKVFVEQVAFIVGKEKLDAKELHEIHMSTYSLEKAVAWYVQNSNGKIKEQAEAIAVIVEEIHLGSENNRSEETASNIQKLSSLAKAFQASL